MINNIVKSPISPGRIHELIPIDLEKKTKYGDNVLPIIPIALAQPKPKLLTLVGNSSAIYI